MTYKLTTKVLDLVEQLYAEGYGGNATLCRYGCTGTQEEMSDNGCTLWIELSGFAKETLNLAENLETGEIVAIGRYSYEGTVETVEDIVRKSWEMFGYHEGKGYSMPSEFESLFEKYGFIQKEEVVVKKTKVTRLK